MNRNRVQDIFYRQLKSQKSIYWPSRQIQGSDFQIEPHQVCALLFVTKFVVKYVTTFVTNCCRNRHKDVSKMITLQLSSDRHRNITEMSRNYQKTVTRPSQSDHRTITESSQSRHRTVTKSSQDRHPSCRNFGSKCQNINSLQTGRPRLQREILYAMLTSTLRWNFEPLMIFDKIFNETWKRVVKMSKHERSLLCSSPIHSTYLICKKRAKVTKLASD